MKTVDVKVDTLSEKTFLLYGKVLDSTHRKPDSEEVDFKFYYNLIEADFAGPVAISMVESKLQEDLLSRSLETHYNTPEVLIPLDGTIYLLLAKSMLNDRAKPDLSTVKAFVVNQGQGVLLPQGIWHRAPLSRGMPVKTCCLIRKGTPDDIILTYLDQVYGSVFRIVE